MGFLRKLHLKHDSPAETTPIVTVASVESNLQDLYVEDRKDAQSDTMEFGGNMGFTPHLVDDNVVKDMTCVLRRFGLIFDKLQEAEIITEDVSDAKSRVFFRAAEIRYMMWLDLLKAKGKAYGRSYLTTELLPPWDVAIMFYTHLNQPFAFLSDIHYSDRWASLAGIEFPWDKFSMNLQDDGCFINRDPDNTWRAMYPDVPYQPWRGSPFCNNEITFPEEQRLPVECPWCRRQTLLTFDFASNSPSIQHRNKCCDSAKLLDPSAMAIRSLANDAQTFLDDHGSNALQHLKRAQMNSYDGSPRSKGIASVLRDLRVNDDTFFNILRHSGDSMTIQELVALLSTVTSAPTTDQATRDSVNQIVRAYRTNPQPSLSDDLAATVMFTKQIATHVTGNFPAPEMPGVDEMASNIPLFKSRYWKFMNTINSPDLRRAGVGLFPLDVLMVWKTHVLMPNDYHGWCSQQLGTRVDYPTIISDEEDSAARTLFAQRLRDQSNEEVQPDLMYELCVQALNQEASRKKLLGRFEGVGPTTTVVKNQCSTQSADGKSYRKEQSYSKTRTLWSKGTRPVGSNEREPVENDFSAAMDG